MTAAEEPLEDFVQRLSLDAEAEEYLRALNVEVLSKVIRDFNPRGTKDGNVFGRLQAFARSVSYSVASSPGLDGRPALAAQPAPRADTWPSSTARTGSYRHGAARNSPMSEYAQRIGLDEAGAWLVGELPEDVQHTVMLEFNPSGTKESTGSCRAFVSMALETEPDDPAVDPLHKDSPSRRPYTPLFPTFHKATARIVSFAGQRNLSSVFCPVIASYDTVNFYDSDVYPGVTGLVALTIDDSPCRQAASACMARQVADLLLQFGAHATFFVTAEFVAGKEEDMVRVLVDGHEVANHCMHEAPCIHLEEEEFEKQLMNSEAICEDLRQRAVECKRQQDVRHPEVDVPLVPIEPESEPERTKEAAESAGEVASKPIRWFRAPSALMNTTMLRVLQRHGYTHVLGDCYANDPFVTDPEFLASTMLENVMDGSVLVIHMPERGFREYNLEALRQVLQGLENRGLKAVTLSSLHAASMKQAELKEPESSMFSNLLPDIVSPDKPAQHLHRSSNIFKGTLNAAVSVTRGTLTGAAALFVKPYEGARDGGVAGFASGLGQGLVGVVAKPVDGALEGGMQIIGGVAGNAIPTHR